MKGAQNLGEKVGTGRELDLEIGCLGWQTDDTVVRR